MEDINKPCFGEFFALVPERSRRRRIELAEISKNRDETNALRINQLEKYKHMKPAWPEQNLDTQGHDYML